VQELPAENAATAELDMGRLPTGRNHSGSNFHFPNPDELADDLSLAQASGTRDTPDA
jgi:hypothetical protein